MNRANWLAMGAVFVAPVLGAQSLALPGSDPVNIARGGTGVAFGRSLEAAALNPALLATLSERGGFYVGAGEEFQSTQTTLQSNQQILYSTDRNRFLPSFGAGWRVGENGALGLKVDVPFLRHGRFDSRASSRFQGDEISLKTLRLELQGALKFGDQGRFSAGVSVGAMKIDLASGTTLRALVPGDPSQPVSPTNPSQGLVESRVRQEGSVTVGTAGLGFRWAINPRWTFGIAGQIFLKGDPKPTASETGDAPSYYANDGFSTAPLGLPGQATQLLGASRAVAGTGKVALPARAALGFRHRYNSIFTWEADFHFVQTSRLELPSLPTLSTPNGSVVSPAANGKPKDTTGFSLAGELQLGKLWTVRGGASLDLGFRNEADVEPQLGGARTAAFSVGCGYRAWGGELLFGYQVRLVQDLDSSRLDGAWSSQGYRSTGTLTRVEHMGHVYSIGFRKSF